MIACSVFTDIEEAMGAALQVGKEKKILLIDQRKKETTMEGRTSWLDRDQHCEGGEHECNKYQSQH